MSWINLVAVFKEDRNPLVKKIDSFDVGVTAFINEDDLDNAIKKAKRVLGIDTKVFHMNVEEYCQRYKVKLKGTIFNKILLFVYK